MRDAFGHPQTAILFGGTSEIGLATIDLLVGERLSDLVLVGRSSDQLQAEAARLRDRGVRVTTVVADAEALSSAGPAVDDAFSALDGPCDLVLMAVGVLGDQARDDDDAARTATMFAVNTAWPAAVLAACRPKLVAQGSGQVLVLSSVAAVRTRRANYTYGAGKMGLDGFALGYAESLRGTGVDVKILRPGFVTTKMTAHLSPVPFSTDAQAVAARAVAALRGRATVVWSPKVLQVVFTALAHLPAALWRKMPG